jgi:glucokinase
MKENRVIGVDLGGTKILAGIVDPDGTVHETAERPTVTSSEEALLDEIAAVVRDLPLEGVAAVGFGVPARVDQQTGVALGAVNIPLDDVAFRSEMEGRLGLPVAIENDAGVAAYAEFKLGAGRGTRDLVLLTLGTGVGGGVVIGGSLYHGWAELGHVVVVADGEPCQGRCTGRGHVESYCSGTAADRLARKELGPGANAHDLVKQRHASLDGVGHLLGVAIGSLINIFNPQTVLVGGGFGIAAFDLLEPSARRALELDALPPAGEQIVLRRAELGAAAGLIGAGLIAVDLAAA